MRSSTRSRAVSKQERNGRRAGAPVDELKRDYLPALVLHGEPGPEVGVVEPRRIPVLQRRDAVFGQSVVPEVDDIPPCIGAAAGLLAVARERHVREEQATGWPTRRRPQRRRCRRTTRGVDAADTCLDGNDGAHPRVRCRAWLAAARRVCVGHDGRPARRGRGWLPAAWWDRERGLRCSQTSGRRLVVRRRLRIQCRWWWRI